MLGVEVDGSPCCGGSFRRLPGSLRDKLGRMSSKTSGKKEYITWFPAQIRSKGFLFFLLIL